MHKQAQKIRKKIEGLKWAFVFAFLAMVLTVVSLVKFDEGFAVLKTMLIPNNYSLVSEERMKILKTRGCVYDGLLTPRYNQQFSVSVEMLKRSQCQYIHRSVETWNIPPNFIEIKRRMNIIKQATGKKFIYSLFIAESIDVTKGYYDPIRKKSFNLGAMCTPGTFGAWGKNTCKPSIQKKEYREYLSSIMRRAIDLGIEDFTFGQMYYQDQNWQNSSVLIRSIIADAKKYASSKGLEISVGGQTNTMDNEEYLRSFDYITGGIGQNKNGEIQKEGSCWEYYYKRDGYCWAMLWDKKFKNKANNVLVYLDWNNSSTDDIHRFTRMNREGRSEFLGSAYDYFIWHNVGFLMPLGVVLGNVPAGCYGPTREFYSASSKYSCKDEIAIRDILNGKKPLPNHSRFISQEIPSEMEAGKKYFVKIKMENTSFRIWDREDNFRLGSINPKDNVIWGINRVELEGENNIRHGEIKEFVFEVIAPSEIGDYAFDWQMVEEKMEWFGQPTKKFIVSVVERGTEIESTFEENIDLDNNKDQEDDLLTQLINGEQVDTINDDDKKDEGFFTKLKKKFQKK